MDRSDAAGVALARTAGDIFALLIPLSACWPLGLQALPAVVDRSLEPAACLSDLALIPLLLTGLFHRGVGRVRWGEAALAAPVFAIGLLAAATAPLALSPALAGYSAVRWLLAGAVYLRFLQRDLAPQRFVTVLLAGLGIHVVVGIGQVLFRGPVGLPGEMALSVEQWGAAVLDLGGGRWLRAYGLTYHPNVLGGYLAVGLLLGMPLLGKFWLRLLWWMLWIGLLLTFSRSAALATLVTAPLAGGLLYCTQPHLRRSLAVAWGGVVAIGLLGGILLWPQLYARLDLSSPLEWLSLDERQAQWRVAMGILATRPIHGVGAGNFPLAMLFSQPGSRVQPVHNVPLLLASEVGVLGGGAWLSLMVTAVNTLARRAGRLDPWAIAGLCAWLALWIIGLFDYYPWGLNAGRLLSATVLGLAGRAVADASLPGESTPVEGR